VLKHLPKVVYIKFFMANGEDGAWKLEGADEHGLYPTVPESSSCFWDKGRKHAVLKITRRQFPLAPVAITSHAAQGQTLNKGAVFDLRIGRGTKPIASYVAITRVENRSKLLIYRPFERKLFTRGQQRGPEFLLKHLRREDSDWKAIGEEYMPPDKCVNCGCVRYKHEFPLQQWTRKDKHRHCAKCVTQKEEAGTPLECSNCKWWKANEAFPETQRHTN